MMEATSDDRTELRSRFDEVQQRIERAADRSGRSVQDITLIAVTKTHPAAVVQNAIKIGATNFGENRVQEAEGKILAIDDSSINWHLIGHLQANKARRAVKLFNVIHSVDSVELVQRLDRLCEEEQRTELSILIQVDLAGEDTKSGVPESEMTEVVQAARDSERLRLIGLMVLPPFLDDAEQVRPYFRRLREMRDRLKSEGHFSGGGGHLSMGMTHDFEVAIEEGATMVRIGTALFGQRSVQSPV
jgi:pyridoxal phosphate enzyme (YggS family)